MSFATHFVSLVMAIATSFSASYQVAPLAPMQPKKETSQQQCVYDASALSTNSNAGTGVVVIDRAKNNYMTTNDIPAHTQQYLGNLARLFIFFYALRTDGDVVRGRVPDIASMIQGYSNEATDRLWNRYGGSTIIRDSVQRYRLLETTPDSSWATSTSSAVDVARLIRRFWDDKEVSAVKKRWAKRMLEKTTTSLSDKDVGWGLPSAAGVTDGNSNFRGIVDGTTWALGWTSSGSVPMIRHSAGTTGKNMRYIVVTMSQFPETTGDADANRIASQIAVSATDFTVDSEGERDDDPRIKAFDERQQRTFNPEPASRRKDKKD